MMNSTTSNVTDSVAAIQGPVWPKWLQVAGLVYFLLVAVSLIGGGFNMAAGDHAKELFAFASNPVAGLVVGTIATALIQSSSTVTSIIVGLVAGGLPVSIAIPMIMGANIGTTVTNTIVSLGHVRKGEEFRRAFAAATVHDFFNLVSVMIFLPLEVLFGVLEKTGAVLAEWMVGGQSLSMGGMNFVKPLIKPPVQWIEGVMSAAMPEMMAGMALIALGILLIFVSITIIGRLLKILMVGRAKAILHAAVGRGPITGIASGTIMTVLVQSSSTTTSLAVPLAGSGVFTLKQIYPFTLGANIGTCITALLAATAVSGEFTVFALQVALIHLLYNVLGVIVVYGIPGLRGLPVWLAESLAGITVKNKLYAVLYISSVFFILPLGLIALSRILA